MSRSANRTASPVLTMLKNCQDYMVEIRLLSFTESSYQPPEETRHTRLTHTTSNSDLEIIIGKRRDSIWLLNTLITSSVPCVDVVLCDVFR